MWGPPTKLGLGLTVMSKLVVVELLRDLSVKADCADALHTQVLYEK